MMKRKKRRLVWMKEMNSSKAFVVTGANPVQRPSHWDAQWAVGKSDCQIVSSH